MISSFFITLCCLLCHHAKSQSSDASPLEDCISVLFDKTFTDQTGQMISSSSLKSDHNFQIRFESLVAEALNIKAKFSIPNTRQTSTVHNLYIKLDGTFVDKVKLDFSGASIITKRFNIGSLDISKHTLELVIVGKDDQKIYVQNLMVYQDFDQQVSSHLTKPLNLPQEEDMGQNEPNPFQESTTIPFELLKKSMVTIVAYDKHMTPLDTITNRVYNAGYHFASWNSSEANQDIPEGLLLYSIETKDFKYLKKMFRIKPVH